MRRTHLILLSLLALALAPVLATSASAAAHADLGYGKNGVVMLPGKKVPGQSARKAVAIEPSGALILATNRTLQRLDPTGTSIRPSARAARSRHPRCPAGN